ncbi:MAG: rhomboid family intramembrane serine protease [Gammaproteobacteria bacterium]|nr:MAG: rhomboid family intramembrane serine protease [Gammaproteobacteria bacterium]RLA53345.1 MAG: rhomboid family intramembrane serine protease [Gammaproteobacteria bacterium]
MTVKWREMEHLSPDMDLDMLVLALNRLGIDHKIAREDGGTRLWVTDTANPDTVIDILGRVRGMSKANSRELAAKPPTGIIVRTYLMRLPVTIITLVLGVLGTALVSVMPDLIPAVTFQNFTIANGQDITFEPLRKAFARGEWWRLVTPAFLHFGVFHIVFNSLWLWEFGRRIELLVGSGAYLVLVSALTIGANVGQYLWSGPGLFGGLSGVVYGLLGYIWIRGRRIPDPLLLLPKAILPLMLVWLLVCLLGIVDMVIRGGVANGAHVSGLVIGMIFGAFGGRKRNIET